jgi:hypothetical protein
MKKVVHEIHRRSLWQMLGIYLAGSWIALQVVEQLTEAAGLPEWVRPFSLVLLLLGFPIVMATAFIQQGMTGKQAEPPGQSVADGQSRVRTTSSSHGRTRCSAGWPRSRCSGF